MTTQKQIQANRSNALKSTGPTSAAGKLKVSQNRISHGILSSRFLIDGESADEYDELLQQLFQQLTPVGALEQGLVEKIAMSFWRQRRLARAESAAIDLAANPKRIQKEVEVGMGISGFGNELTENDFHEPTQEEQEQLQWCQAVVEESGSVLGATLQEVQSRAPLLFAQLKEDAESDGVSVEAYCRDLDLPQYIREVAAWCHNEAARLSTKLDRYPVIAARMETAKDLLSIPWERFQLLNRYQSSLDNQLYKAMKALREAQEWRLNTIESTEHLEPA